MPARLAQLLVSRMLLTQEKAGEVLRQHQTLGGQVDSVLLEQGIASEADVLALLGEVSGFMPVNLMDFEPNPEVASFIPPKIAERLCVVPLSLDGNTLHVASGYPVPKKELDEVGFLLGKPLELWVATEVRVREWVSTIYRQPLAPRFARLSAALDPEAQAATPPPPPPPAALEEESLTADVVERLARSVAQEPLPAEVSAAPQAAVPRPEAPPQRPPPPPPEALTQAPENLPPPGPPAFVRAPLRLNMPQADAPARPAQRPNPPASQIPVLHPAGAAASASTAPQAAPPSPGAAEPKPAAAATAPSAQQPVSSAAPRAPAQSGTPLPPAQGAPAATPGQSQVWPPAQPGATGTPQVWPPAPAQPAAPPTLHFTTPVAPPKPAAAQPRSEPAFLVFPNPGAAPQSAPPPRPKPAAPATLETRPAPPPASQDVPDWTLAQARAALKDATKDRDRLIDVALRFGRRTFDYVAAFAVLRGGATGLEARGEGMTGEQLTQVSIPLDASSVFRTVAVTRGSYAGPLPPDALTRHYLELFGRQTPRTVFLYPVEVKGRLVAILYGDCGQRPISQRRLSDYILFCQDLPAAFQELILFRKQRVSELRAPDDEELTIDVDLPVAPTPAPAPAVVAGLGWSPFFGRGATGNMGRAAALPPRAQSQEERPPPDFAPLLRRLTGPDAAQRANAMAELARSPEASARVLAQHFPGPTAWSRLPVVELPEADELGPIPGALSRLGRPAAQAVSPLLDSQDADTRYFALLTAGNLPYVELVDGVLRGLFDLEPDISSAARVAAAALKQLPRLDAALRDLRHELNSRDPLRRSLAARALGTLHDRDAIEGLIRLTGGDDEMCAQAAAEALREVTRATLGLDPRPWSAWWAENRSRRRADWLVAALRHRELDVRLAAIEELSRALHDTLGYYADAPEAEREQAVRRWEAAAVEPANARRLGML
ncbi:FrgA protein [Corallococcus macrosporus]|uniref:FrgA protein n=1 Tax=Myxococcus fulvus (strain ATCC BAA-855 / HW-1) TaxID=483219 RepID=F8CGR1_MYXFH|nr:FrgA protein [Corallococcus macrosporus]AEI62518.1 FrgA protein [Corallococcus macrosporus]